MRVLILAVVLALPAALQRLGPSGSAEHAGWDAVLSALLDAFDAADAVMLGEAHTRKVDSDLRLRLIRHPVFPEKARFIVVEFGDARQQPILDRYVAGEEVAADDVRVVRGSGVYAELVDAVREVNRTLTPSRRLRVLTAGQPGGSPRERNARAVSVIREHVLSQRGKALVVFGAGHTWRRGGLTRGLEETIPGRVFVAETLAPVSNGRTGPEYDDLAASLRALETTLRAIERPILVEVNRSPIAKLPANPFYLGQAMLPAETTLGDLQDAIVYFGRDREAGNLVREPSRVTPGEPRRLMAIHYEGSKVLRIGDIEERLRQFEVPVLLDTPFHPRTICVIKEVLVDMLGERGYVDAVVTPEIVPVDRTNERLLRVTFRIADGRRGAPKRPAATPATARCEDAA